MVLRRAFALILLVLVWGCSQDPVTAARNAVTKGDQYYAKARYAEAVIEYKKGVALTPRSPDIRLKLANAYLANLNAPEALGEFVRVADLLPNDVSAQLRAGLSLLLTGNFVDAGGRARKALAIDARNPKALVLLGNSLAGVRDFDQALAQIQNAIRYHPEDSLAYASMGHVEVAMGDMVAADKAFADAVRLSPTSAEAQQAQGDFYWAANRRADAERAYLRVLELDNANLQARRRLSVLYLMSGRAEGAQEFVQYVATHGAGTDKFAMAEYYMLINRVREAMTELEKLGADPSTSVEANLRLASIDLTNRQIDKALGRLDLVFKRYPGSARGLMLQALARLMQGKPDEALKLAKDSLTADPTSPEAFMTLGRIRRVRNENIEALAAYKDALKFGPRSTTALIEAARLSLLVAGSQGALQFADEAVLNDPMNGLARLIRAQALQRVGDLKNAESELRLLELSNPSAVPVLVQKGSLFLAKREPMTAAGAFGRAYLLDPKSLESLAGLVSTDIIEKNMPAARARIEKRLATAPNDPGVLLLAARVYRMDRDFRLAESVLRKVIEVAPDTMDAYTQLSQLYGQENKLDAARAELEVLVKKDPKAIGAHTTIGVIYSMQNRDDLARATYEAVIKADPTAAIAANNLAWIYAQRLETMEAALRLAQTAKAQLPERPEITDTLGWILYRKGFANMATPYLRECVQKDPDNPYYRYHLGMALIATKNFEPGRRELDAAIRLSADFDGVAEARRALALLKQK